MTEKVSGEITTTVENYRLTGVGNVTPPPDLMEAARKSLSAAGFERLMQITGGAIPTPAQLCREADYERQGYYSPPDVTPAELQKICQEAFMIAAARAQLSDTAFKELMHSIDWRGPTPAELCAAVEKERSAKH